MSRAVAGHDAKAGTYTATVSGGLLTLTEPQHSKMVMDYTSGRSIQDISNELALSDSETRSYLRYWGITRSSSPVISMDEKVVEQAVSRARQAKADQKFSEALRKAERQDAERWRELEANVLGPMLQAIRELPATSWPRPALRPVQAARYALVIPLQDIHVGRFASAIETRETCDMGTPSELLMQALDDLFWHVERFGVPERIQLIIGGDWFNIDSSKGTTTRGTPQDNAGTYGHMVGIGIALMKLAVERCVEVAPVDLIVTKGNHDNDTQVWMFHLARELYRSHPFVTTHGDLFPRQSLVYGNTLCVHAHGDGAKPNKLPILIAQECRKDWGKTQHTLATTGHLHHLRMQDVDGVYWCQVPSIAPLDNYHALEGYGHAERAIAGLCIDHDRGFFAAVLGKPDNSRPSLG